MKNSKTDLEARRVLDGVLFVRNLVLLLIFSTIFYFIPQEITISIVAGMVLLSLWK